LLSRRVAARAASRSPWRSGRCTSDTITSRIVDQARSAACIRRRAARAGPLSPAKSARLTSGPRLGRHFDGSAKALPEIVCPIDGHRSPHRSGWTARLLASGHQLGAQGPSGSLVGASAQQEQCDQSESRHDPSSPSSSFMDRASSLWPRPAAEPARLRAARQSPPVVRVAEDRRPGDQNGGARADHPPRGLWRDAAVHLDPGRQPLLLDLLRELLDLRQAAFDEALLP
jgi:hypothetical protein